MSHKKKAYQKSLESGAVPTKRTHYSPDAVQLDGDAECHYYWENGVLYFSERGTSYAQKKFDSPIKAENYLKRKNKKR